MFLLESEMKVQRKRWKVKSHPEPVRAKIWSVSLCKRLLGDEQPFVQKVIIYSVGNDLIVEVS